MSWYLALVVRGSFVDDSLHNERMADMLYKLIEAPDAEAAYQRALQMVDSCAEDYTDDDGTAVSLRGMGLCDLRAIDAPRLADGVEVYAEILSGKASERIGEKEQLTVFEPEEIPEFADEAEAEAHAVDEAEPAEEAEPVDAAPEGDDRFTDNTPIR